MLNIEELDESSEEELEESDAVVLLTLCFGL
jgi:hypothetical protein